MSTFKPVVQCKCSVLISAVRNATQTILGQDILDPMHGDGSRSGTSMDASGICLYLNITAVPTIETLTLSLEEQDPVSLVWIQVGITLAIAIAGMVKFKVGVGIGTIAAGTNILQLNDVLPGIWRVKVNHSAGSNWTYSLGAVIYS